MSDRFHVVTGGPGAGKTTLLDALARRGFPVMPEAGRAVIRHQIAIGGEALPWADRALFAELMLGWELRSHAEAAATAGPVWFDRGVPDVAGYLRLSGLDIPPHMITAAEAVRYAPRVFILPFWDEIFHADAERRQSAAEARATCEMMRETYADFGYDLCEVPKDTVERRVDFVLGELRRT